MTTKGHFIDFELTYAGKSAEEQAREILREAATRIAKGALGVGITYSANFQQTRVIREVYASGEWNAHTGGMNQAAVMHALEQLEGGAFFALQHQLRIVPITTMTYGDFGGRTLDEVIQEDMAAIEGLLETGWDVLGWINQPGSRHYAVGGGVAKSIYEQDPTKALSPAQSQRIQEALEGFAQRFGSGRA